MYRKMKDKIAMVTNLFLVFIMFFSLFLESSVIFADTNSVERFTTTPMIVTSAEYTVALKSDGTVWVWGYGRGRLFDDGVTSFRYDPVQVQGLHNVTEIAVLRNRTIAFRDDGTVWAFSGSTAPIQDEHLNDVIAIDAGNNLTVALRECGTVWTWGRDFFGLRRDGTLERRNNPVQVYGLDNIVAIAAGSFDYAIALRVDGTVWAWGANAWGQLGDGTTFHRTTPVQIQNLNNVVAIATGADHTVALKEDGTVWAWGNNSLGQLGDGTNYSKNSPIQVHNLSNITSIAAGVNHTIALRGDGTVWAWGSNFFYQLGDGTNSDSNITVQVQNLTGIMSITAEAGHNLARAEDGTVWGWGHNGFWQLGRTPYLYRGAAVPFRVIGSGTEYLNLGISTASRELPIIPDVPTSPDTGISQHFQQAITAFLYPFTTLFTGVASVWGNSIIFSVGSEPAIMLDSIADVPYIYWCGENQAFFDIYGNNIYDTVYIDGAWVASDFMLYDPEGSGLPVIIIRSDQFAFNGRKPYAIYSFINGRYQYVGTIVSAEWDYSKDGDTGFYRDSEGRVLFFHRPLADQGTIIAYSMIFTEAYLYKDYIGSWNPWNGEASVVNFAQLTPILRLTDLEEIIRTSVLTGDVALPTFLGYSIEASVNRPVLIFDEGETFLVSYNLVRNYANGKRIFVDFDWTNFSVIISDNDVISAVSFDSYADGDLIVTALSEGLSEIAVIGADTELTINIEVMRRTTNSYRIDNVPSFYAFRDTWRAREIQTNFHANGLYTNNFSYIAVGGGYRVRFNVFNSLHMHGAVDIFDSDGRWIESRRIDRFSHISSIWEAGVAMWDLIGYTIDGAALCYTAPSYSQRTSIDIFVPAGGHFTISNNWENSPGTLLYNAVDFIILGATSTITILLGSFSPGSVSDSFVDNLLSIDKFAEEFLKEYAKIAARTQADNMRDLRGAMTSIAEEIEIILDLSGLDWDIALRVALGVTENAFMNATGPAGFSLRALFGITQTTDRLLQVNQLTTSNRAAFVTIHTTARGMFIAQGVTAIPSEGAVDPDAVLRVFRITSNKPLSFFSQFQYMDYYEIFDISFVKNGNERIGIDGLVTVMLPIPQNFNRNSLHVYHEMPSGVWIRLSTRIEGQHIIFETDSFSRFAIIDIPISHRFSIAMVIGISSILLIVLAVILLLYRHKKRGTIPPTI